MRVRAVLFDAGNTLIRVRGSVGAVYARVAARYGVTADPSSLDARFREAFRRRKTGFLAAVSRPHSPEGERRWWRELVRDVFREAGAWEGLQRRFEPFFDELYAAFAETAPWEVFPDVVPCLETLSARGVAAAVVSNWDSRLVPVLDGLGLSPRLRFVLTSAEFGAEKPDPAIFREACRRLGAAPAEVVHVGDLVRDDWHGARAAGLGAVLLDREDTAPAHIAPRVRSLAELPGAIGFGQW